MSTTAVVSQIYRTKTTLGLAFSLQFLIDIYKMNILVQALVMLTTTSMMVMGEEKKITKLQIGVKKRVEDCPMKSRKGDKLSMHYRGTLHADGSEFDSSYERGEPLSFTLGSGQVLLIQLLDSCIIMINVFRSSKVGTKDC